MRRKPLRSNTNRPHKQEPHTPTKADTLAEKQMPYLCRKTRSDEGNRLECYANEQRRPRAETTSRQGSDGRYNERLRY